jgi:hypothetical protein
MTRYLQGCALKRFQDYMVEYNKETGKFDYWFKEGKHATLFALAVGTMAQEVRAPNVPLTACCPACGHKMQRWEIKWEV